MFSGEGSDQNSQNGLHTLCMRARTVWIQSRSEDVRLLAGKSVIEARHTAARAKMDAAIDIARRQRGRTVGSKRTPKSPAHLRLGQAMSEARILAKLSTRKIPKPDDPAKFFESGHISNVENGFVAPSEELVDVYVRLGGDGTRLRTLFRQMRAAAEQAGARRRRQSADASDLEAPQTLDEITDHREVQKHYFVESQQAHSTFDSRGVLQEFRCVVRLKATAPGARLYYTGHMYESDRRPGILQVEALNGGKLIGTQESPTGAVRSFFELERALSLDDVEPYPLEFRVLVDSDKPARPLVVFHNSRDCAQEVLLSLQFTAPRLPSLIWRFSAEDMIDIEHPSTDGKLPVREDGSYHCLFQNLTPGWSYGLAWVW